MGSFCIKFKGLFYFCCTIFYEHFSVPIKINLSFIQQIPNTYHMSSTLLGAGDIALKKKEVRGKTPCPHGTYSLGRVTSSNK